MKNPTYWFSLISFVLAFAGTAGLWYYVPVLDLLIAWIIAVSVITFLTYGYDKFTAVRNWTRVPERVLLGLAFTGGTPGAILGMRLFHHKTAKGRFRLKFWLVVIVQILLIAGYYYLDHYRKLGKV